jgi:immune inhibitor A
VILVDPTDKACKLGGALSVNCTAAPSSGAAPLTVQFTSTPIGGTGAYTYDWNFGDGTTPDDKTQNPTHTYAGTGTFTATVTVNDGTSVATCTQTITVN